MRPHPHLFDDSYTRWGTIQWMSPDTLLTLGEHLTQRGWSTGDAQVVRGNNFCRVAQPAAGLPRQHYA